jgi:alpha-N-acetylglucosaminidase
MIVLDLQSEQWPQYNRLEEYFGQPFIWCMLHDFGGTLGMFGSSSIVNEVSALSFIYLLFPSG